MATPFVNPALNPSTAAAKASAGVTVEQMDAGADASADEVEILPIGSGGEVGRSCVMLKYKGRNIMFDCGNHPAKVGLDSLPFFDSIKCNEVDLVLITHFHLDHCGALPYLCNQTSFKGRIFMTSTTRAFYKMVMNDFIRVGAGAGDLVTNEWLETTMNRIETIEYREEKMVNGIRFQPFNAGHVLGAATFMVDIAGMRALYTGDFSRVEDRHLPAAEVPPYSPDILIVESTNGIRELETQEERERLFTSRVHEVVQRGGRCLVPVFALGRAQELLLILEQYWEEHKELQNIPIYYASSLAQRCMKLYQTFVSSMNRHVKEQHANHRNPFEFKFIQNMINTRTFDDSGPCVVLASPGMLQSGLSLELFERWCGDSRNGIIMAGYCVDGTIAKDVLSKPSEVVKPDGRALKLRMKTIEAISFSAHSDARHTKEFIQKLPKVKHTVLVHGNAGAMAQLKNKLLQDFKDRHMQVFTTVNQEAIRIPFAVERSAKVMGKLATTAPHVSEVVSGVMLVSGQQSYTLVHPDDVQNFTSLTVSRIRQAMILPLPRRKSPLEVLEVLKRYFAQSQMFQDVDPHTQTAMEAHEGALASGNPEDAEETDACTKIFVARNVTVEVRKSTEPQTTLTITWLTSHYNDLLADVTCIALAKLADDPQRGDEEEVLLPMDVSGKDRLFRVKCFHHMISQFYPSVTTNLVTGSCTVDLPDGQRANIVDCIEVELEEKGTDLSAAAATAAAGATTDPQKRYTSAQYDSPDVMRLKTVLKRIYLTLFPIPVDSGWCDCGMIHE